MASHLQDQLLDLSGCPGSPNRAALAAIVLPRDQPPIPPQQGVGRHECADLKESLSAAKSLRDAALAGSARRDHLGLRREAAALTIGEQ